MHRSLKWPTLHFHIHQWYSNHNMCTSSSQLRKSSSSVITRRCNHLCRHIRGNLVTAWNHHHKFNSSSALNSWSGENNATVLYFLSLSFKWWEIPMNLALQKVLLLRCYFTCTKKDIPIWDWATIVDLRSHSGEKGSPSSASLSPWRNKMEKKWEKEKDTKTRHTACWYLRSWQYNFTFFNSLSLIHFLFYFDFVLLLRLTQIVKNLIWKVYELSILIPVNLSSELSLPASMHQLKIHLSMRMLLTANLQRTQQNSALRETFQEKTPVSGLMFQGLHFFACLF